MMAICPICGKRTVIHWPEHWVYRRGPTYYCSDNCMYVDATRDLKLMHDVQRKRREQKIMARMKKDGTPAKRPGRKPKMTLMEELAEDGARLVGAEYVQPPEPKDGGVWEKLEDVKEKMAEDGVELFYDPSIAEEYRREQEQKKANEEAKARAELKEAETDIWRTTAIKNEKLGEFYYDMKYRTIDWRHPAGEEISLPPEDFAKLADMIPQILHVLGVEE